MRFIRSTRRSGRPLLPKVWNDSGYSTYSTSRPRCRRAMKNCSLSAGGQRRSDSRPATSAAACGRRRRCGAATGATTSRHPGRRERVAEQRGAVSTRGRSRSSPRRHLVGHAVLGDRRREAVGRPHHPVDDETAVAETHDPEPRGSASPTRDHVVDRRRGRRRRRPRPNRPAADGSSRGRTRHRRGCWAARPGSRRRRADHLDGAATASTTERSAVHVDDRRQRVLAGARAARRSTSRSGRRRRATSTRRHLGHRRTPTARRTRTSEWCRNERPRRDRPRDRRSSRPSPCRQRAEHGHDPARRRVRGRDGEGDGSSRPPTARRRRGHSTTGHDTAAPRRRVDLHRSGRLRPRSVRAATIVTSSSQAGPKWLVDHPAVQVGVAPVADRTVELGASATGSVRSRRHVPPADPATRRRAVRTQHADRRQPATVGQNAGFDRHCRRPRGAAADATASTVARHRRRPTDRDSRPEVASGPPRSATNATVRPSGCQVGAS